jgi:hypothetical protein
MMTNPNFQYRFGQSVSIQAKISSLRQKVNSFLGAVDTAYECYYNGDVGFL